MDARTSAIFLFSTGNTLFRQIWSKKKNQNGTFKLKFGTQTNLNVQNSMMMFNFSVFDWKYTFWANLVQKIEIGFLSQPSTNHMTEREGREHSFNFSLPLLPGSQTLRHCPGNYC